MKTVHPQKDQEVRSSSNCAKEEKTSLPHDRETEKRCTTALFKKLKRSHDRERVRQSGCLLTERELCNADDAAEERWQPHPLLHRQY
ncbi:hypothetical protein CRUP_006602 [Coryphaenoides rupestris]|nr:hypothetical protein CRUP_006602 [Coryphaenoides rupestris]